MTAVRLTGEDLTPDDVWSVAVDGVVGRARRLRAGEAARRASGRRRGAAERGADLRRDHRLRSLRLDANPRRARRGAPAPTAAKPRLRGRGGVPARDRQGRDADAREHAGEGVLRDARRGGRAASGMSRARIVPRVPSRGRSGRAATSHLSRTLRCPWSARGAHGSKGSSSPAPTRSPVPGSSRSALRPRKGSRSSTARSSWALSLRSGSSARSVWRRWPTPRAR